MGKRGIKPGQSRINPGNRRGYWEEIEKNEDGSINVEENIDFLSRRSRDTISILLEGETPYNQFMMLLKLNTFLMDDKVVKEMEKILNKYKDCFYKKTIGTK